VSLLNWIFDIYQHGQIDEARGEARKLRSEMESLRAGSNLRTPGVEQAIGELALAIRTLRRVLTEGGICTDEQFQAKLREVDLEDGTLDGRSPLG